MSTTPYIWRKLTPSQRRELLDWRKQNGLPWHRTPHYAVDRNCYHITVACYLHKPHIGFSRDRLESFCLTLTTHLTDKGARIHAWCVLPNHYHALVETTSILDLITELGRMHGRLSFRWNGEESTRGRQVWCGATERFIRNDRHFWATMNYINHNPVHHGYVQKWNDWPYSSALDYLNEVGKTEASRIWKDYPILDYGKSWDGPSL